MSRSPGSRSGLGSFWFFNLVVVNLVLRLATHVELIVLLKSSSPPPDSDLTLVLPFSKLCGDPSQRRDFGRDD